MAKGGLEHILRRPVRRRRHISRLHQHLELMFRARISCIGSVNQPTVRVRQLIAAIADFVAVLRVVDQVLVAAVDGQTPEPKWPNRWLP